MNHTTPRKYITYVVGGLMNVTHVCVVFQVIQQVQTGRFLECPRFCQEEIYKIMLGCWKRQPADRLTMKHIVSIMRSIQQEQPLYIECIA